MVLVIQTICEATVDKTATMVKAGQKAIKRNAVGTEVVTSTQETSQITSVQEISLITSTSQENRSRIKGILDRA